MRFGAGDIFTGDSSRTTGRLSASLAKYQPKIADNIFDAVPLLEHLSANMEDSATGLQYSAPLMYGSNSTAQMFSYYDTLDNTPQSGFRHAVYPYRNADAAISISWEEEMENTGDAIFNLLIAKEKQAELSLRKFLNTKFWANKADSTTPDKDPIGLEAMINATSTIGGLDSSSLTWWQSHADTVGSFASNGTPKMYSMIIAIQNDSPDANDKPTMCFTTPTVFGYYNDLLDVDVRYTNTKSADRGFMELSFYGIPIRNDQTCPAGKMYFVNNKYLKLLVDKRAKFSTTSFREPDNQMAKTAYILFRGNLCCDNRRTLGVLSSITA